MVSVFSPRDEVEYVVEIAGSYEETSSPFFIQPVFRDDGKFKST
jgi:hypothetical protein